tara:strand:- start:8456 stop:8869 length:414 start_codon:yes stop_codon:yes gene_type:complete
MKNGMSATDFDLIMFLEDEGYFTMYNFDEFAKLIPWEKKRLYRLIREGWIDSLSSTEMKPYRRKYRVSMKGRTMVNKVYSILNGETLMANTNMPKMSREKTPYAHVAFKNGITRMNEESKAEWKRNRAECEKKRAEG